MAQPQLAYNVDDQDGRLVAFMALLEEKGVLGPSDEPRRMHTNPIRYPHVWFIILSLVTAIATTSSLYPRYIFEHMIFVIIACNLIALILSLVQDVPLTDPPKRQPSRIGGFWRRFQEQAGIKVR